MLRLTLRDLQFRALRFLLTVVGTGLVFSLVMVMTGLAGRFRDESQRTVGAFGADGWVVAAGVDGPFTGAPTIPASVADQAKAAGADRAGALSVGTTKAVYDGAPHSRWMIGFVPGDIGAPRIVEGRSVQRSGELVANDDSGAQIGKKVKIGTRMFEVVGYTHDRTVFGGVDMFFLDLGDSQRIFYSGQPIASAVLYDGDPEKFSDEYKFMTSRGVADDIFESVKETSNALDLVALMLWIAAVSLMAAVVYLTALDRLRDFAVIKAHGGSTGSLLASLVFEAILIALVSAGAGVVLQRLVAPLFPFSIDVPEGAYVRLAVLASVAGIVASLGAVRRAAKVDPVIAFSAAG